MSLGLKIWSWLNPNSKAFNYNAVSLASSQLLDFYMNSFYRSISLSPAILVLEVKSKSASIWKYSSRSNLTF